MVTSRARDRYAQVAVGSASMPGMGAMTMAGGGALLVNGQRLPVHTAVPGATERWRIVNATADRYLRLGLDGLISDRPDVLRGVLRGKGRPVPSPAGAGS